MIRYAWGRKPPAPSGPCRDAAQTDPGFPGGRFGHHGPEGRRSKVLDKGDLQILNTLFV